MFLLTLPMLAISTGFGRVDNSSSMFLCIISMVLFTFLELETDMGPCCPTRGSGEVFIFRWSIIVSREDRSRFLELFSPVPQPLFEEKDPDLFLLGGFVFFRAMLSQRWRWPRMRSSWEYAGIRNRDNAKREKMIHYKRRRSFELHNDHNDLHNELRNNRPPETLSKLTIRILVGTVSVLVDSVEIQLSSERLVGTHTRKVQRHYRLFESNLAVNLEGFAIGQPRDDIIETFSFHVFEEIIHLVGEVFGFPFDVSTDIRGI